MSDERINVQARFQITVPEGTSLNGEFMQQIQIKLDRLLRDTGWVNESGAVMVANVWRGEMGGQVVPMLPPIQELLDASAAVVAYSGGPIDLDVHYRLQRAVKAVKEAHRA